MIMLKEGVRLKGISARLVLALHIADTVFDQFERPLVITSASDGQHQEGSWHYRGEAVDLRSKHLASQVMKTMVLNELKRRLIGFDVLLEHPEQDNEHFHIEPAGSVQ